MTNHMPWDNGSIADTFAGLVTPAKSTKTQCGKRVAIGTANHNAETTCTECLAEMQRRAAGAVAIAEYMQLVNTVGIDAANDAFAGRTR